MLACPRATGAVAFGSNTSLTQTLCAIAVVVTCGRPKLTHVLIEWSEDETAVWIADARPILLMAVGVVLTPDDSETDELEPLPGRLNRILHHIARWIAGYDSGLGLNEEDWHKADMENCPDRWATVTVEQVWAKCRHLGVSPKVVNTIGDFVQRCEDGRRFDVRSSYLELQFN